ncbi:MAG: AsmA family protein [Rhodobacter sp.]|nr:AsmA family protein [Rhodobacter sp.]
MRWVFRLVSAVVIVVIAAVALLFLLPADKIAKLATDRLRAETGRAVTIAGDVRPSLWPELGVSTGAVSVANADWSDGGPMLRAEGLSIGVDIRQLLGGTIRIRRVEAVAPQILLEIAADGRANWDLQRPDTGSATAPAPATGDSGDSGSGGGLTGLSLDRAEITGGALTFVDHRSGARTTLSDVDATIRIPDPQGRAEMQASAVMNGQPFSLDASIGAFATLMSEAVVPVTADTSIGGSTIAFRGNAGLLPVAAGGRINADLKDMAAVFALVGQAAPALPRGLGKTAVISGDFTMNDRLDLTLRDATIQLDQNVLSGAVDVAIAEKPRITARLTASALDFSMLGGSGGGGGTTGSTGASTTGGTGGWSRDPIDISGLQAVDADVALGAASIDLGFAQLGRTRLLTRLDNGRAVTEIGELSAYGGSIGGSFVVNSGGGLSVRANLAGDGVALQPLLQQLAGYDRLLANGDVTINLLGVGNNMHTLMNSLNGDGTLKLGKGALQGLDLVGMLRNFDTSFVGEGAKTIFDGITGTFTVVDGVMSNVDLKFVAPLLNATGSGKIGIGGQTLDYRVTARLLEGQTNGGLSVPLMITGTWAKPKFRIDLEALAKQELADDVEKVKTRVEDAVKDKLQEELGVKVDDPNNVEDVLKKELEQRAKKGLLDLLGGN